MREAARGESNLHSVNRMNDFLGVCGEGSGGGGGGGGGGEDDGDGDSGDNGDELL